ncbi:NAD-dependent deacetylase sirtuin 2-like protein [Operophtera brumata]|uniref:protein acetyllysine N-acetyltransferase n=1 Tax=Operophtera brumata TaxID=104452 RepID=A0A0L7L3I8_OPEBR|nr:NAD-dependent deacetylase sirtuin 2-like protein [Operophtera brumata]
MSANSPPGKSNGDEPEKRSPIVPPNESETESISSRIRDWDVDSVRRYLAQKLGLYEPPELPAPSEKVLDDVNIDGIVKWIQSEKCKNVITLSGAGISTSAGIPDFRSPETGLYHNLQKYNLPEPQAIFEINFFRQNPKPFFMLAKELYPGSFKPTISHYFIRLLHEKERIFADQIPICTECPGVVKPDIVFFGESLPERFQECLQEDFQHCDLLIIMGSSLEVQPFASLIDMVPDWCPRLLLNREKAGVRSPIMRMLGMGGGLQLEEADELSALVASEHERLERDGVPGPPTDAPRASGLSHSDAIDPKLG